jgi:hypothetical protein
MGNISSDVNNDCYEYKNTVGENDFQIITETNNNIPIVRDKDLIINLKNIQSNYDKLFSIYRDIILENKEKIE